MPAYGLEVSDICPLTYPETLGGGVRNRNNFIAAAVQTCFFDVVDAIHPDARRFRWFAVAVPAVSGRR